MEKNVLYYQITRDLFLLSDPSYDIDEVGIDNPILNECELYNNGYEHVITEWRKQLNVSLDDVKQFNSDIYKNTKKPRIV
tara:strand:+ start:645 stop:884 length:240 start_codon:yes stop_codon:yes gene_type:complete